MRETIASYSFFINSTFPILNFPKGATGIDIGRTTFDQINAGTEVSCNELKPSNYVRIREVYKFWRARRIK